MEHLDKLENKSIYIPREAHSTSKTSASINGKAANITWHSGKVYFEDRCRNLNQKGMVIWFTGLSGSGKSTLAVELEKELIKLGRAAYILDGDNLRHGLNSDLGFTEKDRNENIRRAAEVAALFKDAGIITIAAFISPYKTMRAIARDKVGKDFFIEVYVKADINTCILRDPKGLYKRSAMGEINGFTGISSVYEEPDSPELILDTTKLTVEECTERLLKIVIEKSNTKCN